jgi:citrate lyase subunit beta/citryl-CoA lyase
MVSGNTGRGAETAALERSMLFVPALRWSMLQKAARSAADAVCIDLEDSVPPSEKVGARATAVRALRELDWGGRLCIVRINGLETSWACGDIAEVLRGAGQKLHRIMIPKVAGPLDLLFAETVLSQQMAHSQLNAPIFVEAQIENAEGFLNVAAIAASTRRLKALVFGQGDYSASLQMPASGIGTFDANDEVYPGHRYHAVVHALVAAARAHGLQCTDGPYSAFSDSAGLERACRIARAAGFDGKQCIHPSQLETVNRIFSPSGAEVDHARRVVKAYERAASSGTGAVALDAGMVDEANVRMARVVLGRQAIIERSGSA